MRVLRLKKGLTMKQVGKLVGRSESCISHYEKGLRKLPVTTAKTLANEYGCEWQELYNDLSQGNIKKAGA